MASPAFRDNVAAVTGTSSRIGRKRTERYDAALRQTKTETVSRNEESAE